MKEAGSINTLTSLSSLLPVFFSEHFLLGEPNPSGSQKANGSMIPSRQVSVWEIRAQWRRLQSKTRGIKIYPAHTTQLRSHFITLGKLLNFSGPQVACYKTRMMIIVMQVIISIN